MGKLVQSLKAGDAADMVIVTSEVVENLKGQIVLPAKGVARVGIGVAVNEKAPSPDISTVDAFRKTLLAAKSVVYIDPKVGTSGKHLAEVFKKLNVEREIYAKATLGTGGHVTE